MKRNKLLTWFMVCFVGTGILYTAQFIIVSSLKDSYYFHYPVWGIYLFHIITTISVLSIIYLVSKKLSSYVGFTFMGLILFKMTAALLFLIPLIKLDEVSKIPDFISFFVPYFLFLFFELLVAVQFIKHSKS